MSFLVGLDLNDVQVQTDSGNASTTGFTLDVASTTNAVAAYISGVRQLAGTDYSVSATTITFTTAPPTGTNNIMYVYTKAAIINTPADASVTEAKLASGVSSVGQHTIWVPAAAMEAAVTTAAASSNAVEIGTSLFAARTMDFATGADDFCYFGIQMPKSWNAGTLVCQFVWSATGTTANTVLWGIAATSLGNDEVLTTAFASPTLATLDTNSTTADDLMVSAEVTLTVGSSPTAEDYVIFEVSRDVTGDTLAEDARLHGIKIHYTTDTGSDS